MAITGIGSNYNNVYEGTYATEKNEAAKKAEMKEAAPAQAGKSQNTGERRYPIIIPICRRITTVCLRGM